ncbi:hypothetical protein L7F22_005975 [Adiantum nelumboides]|nr:hypothetical protein [Adiantum nelumboides]
MECNKEEAEKCKAISEASLKKLDLAAARKFALKAKQHFPELDGLAQLFSILDVHIAAHQKLRNGDFNWYAILQVDFRADENTVRKQYRKLALFLHPDKNKAFGAEAAFKHISEAWSVLSDGKKKSDYDKRWFAQMVSQRARPPHTAPAFQARANIDKQQISGVRQSQQHMQQHQLHRQAHQGQSHVHHQQGQSHAHHQQGQGQVHANESEWNAPERQEPGKGLAQQRGPSHVNAHQQGQTRINQQQMQWQGTAYANRQQWQCQTSIQQQGQAQPCQQQQEGQTQAQPCQQQQEGQTQAQPQVEQCAYPQQWKENLHAHLQQRHSQPHPNQQEMQDQGNDCHLQQQAHTQKQQQSKQPGQGEGLARQQAECGQVGQADTHQQQQQGRAYVLQRGKVHAQQQGQSQNYYQQEVKAHARQQKVQAKLHAEQQERGKGRVPAERQHHGHVPEQGQGQEHGHQHQGQGEACVLQQPDEQGAESKQAHFSKPPFAQDKSVFWTACPHCKLQLEYEMIYMNKNLCCPLCYKPFFSKKVEPIQGTILWQRPMQEHREASEKNAGNKSCTVDESECIPEVDFDKKEMKAETCNTSQEKCQKTAEATVCAEKGTKKQEQKGKVGIHKTCGVCKIQPSMKVVTNHECSREGGNPAASFCINRSGVEDKVSALTPFVQTTEAASEQTARVGTMAEKRNKLHEYDRVRNLNSAGQTSASRTLDEQSISEAANQKVAVKEKTNNGDDCNSRVRTRNSAKTKEIGGPRVNAIRYVADRARALLDRKENVANIERRLNDVDRSNLRLRRGHSAGLKENGGSQKGLYLSKLGNPEVELPQLKRKLASSAIDELETFGTMKKLKGTFNEVEPECEVDLESEGHLLPKDSKSSHRNSLQADAADGLPDECEMEVPDADFYNFDEDRTERHFAVSQIWATYDDDDGMPRYYARVNKILSKEPFKLQMNWLEACNPTDETLAWLEAGFQHSCGDFKLGSVYIADQVSTFSHLVVVDKMPKGGYKIFPRKGDVWAVYKEWEFLKVRDDQRGYEMVEILATYDEKKGVKVAPLYKVAGFKTIFERKPGEQYMRWIPLLEIRRFSHQVPAHPVMAGKASGIQADCLEIDPASAPMNLIVGEQ